jgi:WD40 repeat protein
VEPVFSQDGKLLALISDDKITVYQVTPARGGAQDAAEPKKLWQGEAIEHFSFSPDGATVAYNFMRLGMCLADAQSGQLIRTLGSGQSHSDFAFEPHGSRVAICSATSIQIIDCNTGELQADIPSTTSFAAQLAWHPGGEFLVAWTNTNAIDVWNVDKRERAYTLPHRGMPSRLAFNADGSILVSITLWNQRLVAWNLGTTQRLLEMTDVPCHAHAAELDGRIVWLALDSDTLQTWELTPGLCRSLSESFDTPLEYWGKVAISPEGRLIAFSSQECLELWDAESGRRLWGKRFGDCSADFDDRGRLLVGCEQGLFRLARRVEHPAKQQADRNSTNETVVHFDSIEKLTDPLVPWSLALNASGKTAVFFDNGDEPWRIVDTDSGRRLNAMPQGDARRGTITGDNRFVALSGWEDGGTGIWDAQSGNKVIELNTGPHGVPLFSPDGKLLATTPSGVTLWRTDDWKPLHNLHAVGTTPTGLGITFSPDSRALVIGHVGGAIGLVDVKSGTEFAN